MPALATKTRKHLRSGYVNLSTNDVGHLILSASPGFLADAAERVAGLAEGEEPLFDLPSIHDAMESHTCNGFEWVAPEDIGALTACDEILTDGERIWWHESYCVEDTMEELAAGNEVIYRLADTWTAEEWEAYQNR